LQNVFRAIGKISNSDITVLIRGESGTGKELIAQAVHDNSLRKDKPFVAINVAAIPHELLESELFGHEKGAFTGAQAQRTGRFEQALGGTLFLDEIGDMHPELQTRLLRVLSSQEFYRVGGHKPIKSDVRIIAATNQSIEELIKTSKFREDLYHRLNVFKLELPPLRQRKEDIPSLISHFLKTAAIELNTEQKMINKKTMTFLEAFDWPGNIRQLENTCRYLTVMSASSIISMDDLPQDIFNDKGLDENQKSHDVNWQTSLEDFIRSEIGSDKNILKKVNSEIEKILIDESLRASNGIKLEAAKLLGWGRNTLARKAKNT
jgi:two-component system nitrogen regulation response regulator GlnG